MAYDHDEQEQIESMKAWWDKYGNVILGFVTLALIAVLSWQGWNWYQRNQAAEAGGYFDALVSSARQGQAGPVVNASETLRSRFGSTVYAPRGALIAADVRLANGDVDGARAELAWVIAEGKDPALAAVARVRLVSILIDQKDFDGALAQVDGTPPPGFEAVYADARGDVFFARGEAGQARQAWQQALDAFALDNPLRNVVWIKIEALGGPAA